MLIRGTSKRIINFRTINIRQIHSSYAVTAPEKSPLFILRQRTGIAYSLCREALNKYNNDIDQAEAWLKAQALALGLQKAGKVSGRETREGLVGLAVSSFNNIATVVEVNCETDFVAKNELFKNLTLDIVHQISSMQNGCDVEKLIEDNLLEKLTLKEDQLKSLDSQIVPVITKLGENIRIQRAAHFKSNHRDIQLFGQIHSKNGHKTADNMEFITGRFGAIVALKNFNDSNKSMRAFGNRLCRHVIGYSPTYIELPEIVRKNLEQAEKERKESEEATKTQTDGYNSDTEMQSEQSSTDDWPSIMDQRVILGDGETVRDFCKHNDFSIIYFNRFECGTD